MSGFQTPFLREINVKTTILSGIASSSSVSVTGLEAEDTVLLIWELTTTPPADLGSDYLDHGDGWLQLNTDTNGEYLAIMWHDADGGCT